MKGKKYEEEKKRKDDEDKIFFKNNCEDRKYEMRNRKFNKKIARKMSFVDKNVIC